MAAAINGQGDVARALGDLDLAAGLYRRARGLLKAIGSRSWVYAEYNTGLVHLARGDQKRAQGMLEVAMELFTEQGNSAALANAHLALALCSALEQQWILWDEHLREATGLLGETGFCDEDTARLATRAGATAAREVQIPRAREAYALAGSLWTLLDRKREITEVERALAVLAAQGP
jgi:tetratricopeptide (TPR) repeat protein